MSLKGSLNSVDLANIFQMLSINQKEGTLNIFDGESKKSIYFSRDGVSMLSRGKPKQDSLGQILLRFDHISPDNLERSLQMQKANGKLLGALLEEQGIVPREAIESALRTQIEEEIYNLFIWKDAEFEFIEGIQSRDLEENDGNIRKLTFNVNSIIMEAARRIDEWEHIRSSISATEEIYRYTGENARLTDPIFRAPYCEKILGAIDGRNNVDEIISNSHVNKFEVCKVIALLLDQGAIEPVPPSDLEEMGSAAIREGSIPEGIKYLKRIVDQGKGSQGTQRLIADAYQGVHEIEKAARHYRSLAEACVARGDIDEALAVYSRTCEMLPTDLAAAEKLIQVYVENRDNVSEEPPKVAEKGTSLANMLMQIGHRDRAIAVLRNVIALDPEQPSLRYQLVNALLEGGVPEGALDEYRFMVDWHTRKRNWDEVEKLLRKMLVLAPDDGGLHQRLDQVVTRKQNRSKRLRRVVWVTLISLVLGAGGYVYFQYDLNARQSIEAARSRSSEALLALNSSLEKTEAELDAVTRELGTGSTNAETLLSTYESAVELQDSCQSLIKDNLRELEDVADRYRFSTVRSSAIEKAEEWKALGRTLNEKLKIARNAMHWRAVEMASAARALNDDGRIRAALELYRKASDLAVGKKTDQLTFADEVRRIISLIEQRHNGIEAALGKLDGLIAESRFSEARALAVGLVRDNFDLSEVLEKISLPIQVLSEPDGAVVHVNGESTDTRTPGWVVWHPGLDSQISLELASFIQAAEEIPAVDVLALDTEINRIKALESIHVKLHREPCWREKLPAPVRAEAAAEGNNVYVVTREGEVFGIDTGTRRRRLVCRISSFEGVASGPLVHNDKLYLATIEGTIERVDLKTGRRDWSKKVPGRVYAPLIQCGGKIIVGDSTGAVTVLNQTGGAMVWRRSVPGGVEVRPAMGSGNLLVTSTNGRLYTLDFLDGRTIRVTSPEKAGDKFTGTPVVHAGRIHLGTKTGVVAAYDLSSGEQVWRHDLEAEMRAGPTLVDGAVVVGTLSGRLHAIRSGTHLYSMEVEGAILSSAVRIPGVEEVCVSNDTGLVLGLSLGNNGFKTCWRVDLRSHTGDSVKTLTPAVCAGTRVAVATEGGDIFLLSR